MNNNPFKSIIEKKRNAKFVPIILSLFGRKDTAAVIGVLSYRKVTKLCKRVKNETARSHNRQTHRCNIFRKGVITK